MSRFAIGFCAVLAAATCICLLVAVFVFGTMEQYDRELAVRAMFAHRAFDITHLNDHLKQSGSSLRVSGEVDEIGTPHDPWFSVADEVFRADGDRRSGIAVLVSAFVCLVIALVLGGETVRHRTHPERPGSSEAGG